MTRILIAIGCDQYDSEHIGDLAGAENDAANIFAKLVTEKRGQFDETLSKLLLSPTHAEVNCAFEESLFGEGTIDCLTIYYAGHGIVKDGVYFLTSRDSELHKLSVSAIPTSSVFSYINEAQCGHTNIIMDSCEAAGVVNDIGSLLKPEIIGKENAISVSILAASASTQGAEEANGQGICTKAILDCMDGQLDIHTNRPTLDLNDLGQIIAPYVASDSNQNPEYWGISLKGHVPFCSNPIIEAQGREIDFSLETQLPKDLHGTLSGSVEQIWSLYFALNEGFDHIELLNALRKCVGKLDDHPLAAAEFVKTICSSFIQKIGTQSTGFERAEILGVGVASMLKFSSTNEQVDLVITEICGEIVTSINDGVLALLENMRTDKFHLLVQGFSEHFFLPIRISKILGWIGASIHISHSLGIQQNANQIRELVLKIIEDYSPSVFSVSDSQAPYVACFSSAANSAGLTEVSETITSLMFSTYLQVDGRVTSTSVKPKEIMRYLLSTENRELLELQEGTLARPSELLSLFFVLYRLHGMTDELDRCLGDLDHSVFNIYVPAEYRLFGEDRIAGGQNFTSQIGHGVWTSCDFEQRWEQISNELLNVNDLNNTSVYMGAIIASLIDNNRVPWFLFSDSEAS